VTPTALVLWDVDLTLMQAGPLGRELYAAAFQRATGRRMESFPPAAGRLDQDIFRDALAAHRLDASDHPFPRFAEALTAVYTAGADELGRQGRALPGAAEALAALARVPGVVQTVVTGNIAPVARIKLAAFGLDRFLDLAVGAYGPDDHVRAHLVGMAQRRAGARYGARFDLRSTLLVGDTPHDVAAARIGGARMIAVASGRYTERQLRAAGATAVLPDLNDVRPLLRAVRPVRRG